MKIRACDLYYDSEASYRAVSRQSGIAPYRIFKIINALGANCKSTVDVASELKPRGVISDLLPEFFGIVRWFLPGMPHQFCTYHAYRATEFYFKYHYTGGNKLWAEKFLLITKIICRCKASSAALRAIDYLERHQDELR